MPIMLTQTVAMFLMMAVGVAVQTVVIWTYCAFVITRDRTVLDARRIASNPAVAAVAVGFLLYLLSAVPALSLPILLLAPLEPAVKVVLLIGFMCHAGTTAATLCQVFGKGGVPLRRPAPRGHDGAALDGNHAARSVGGAARLLTLSIG